jgi:aryl-alcohol dehydrogenase-like predicted oxidoreductase
MNRRQFLGTTLAGIATATITSPALGEEKKKSISDLVPLGNTGIKVSRLAFGTGTHGTGTSSDQTKLGMDKLTELLCHAYDSGIAFFDTADSYGSHTFMRNALKTIPREKVVIESKIWWRFERDPRQELDRFRKELGTDYIDTVLLHCMMEDDWPSKMERYRDALSKAKEEKIIRAHGFSCHSLGALKAGLACDWVDVAFARINPAGKYMDGPPDTVVPILKNIHDSGKGLIGMKILGEGTLADQRDGCLKYVLGLGTVDTLVIGFTKREEIDDIIKRMNRHLNLS